MDDVLDILRILGVGAAVGLRPFLATLAVGGLAAGDVVIDFDGSDGAFLESPAWLAAVAAAFVASVVLRRRLDSRYGVILLDGLGFGAALLLSLAITDSTGISAIWLALGGLAAILAADAVRDLFGRVRPRLDEEAAAALPAYAEAAGLVLAAAAILAPPLSLVAVAFLAWLRLGGRRREGEKYAGLRILR